MIARKLRERWRATVPGQEAHTILSDTGARAVFVSDGWSVPYAALRLHRLELETGEHVAEVRTRHQAVHGLTFAADKLYASTDTRLFELSPTDLAVTREWDRRLIRYAGQLIFADGKLALANWLSPAVGFLDLDAGKVARLRVATQPTLFVHDGDLMAVGGLDGGLFRLDAIARRKSFIRALPPIVAVATGSDVWAVEGGPVSGGEGTPSVWKRHGSNVIVNLGQPTRRYTVPGRCGWIECDDARGVIWCGVGDVITRQLVALSQGSGRVAAIFDPPAGFRIVHVDPSAGLVFATEAHPVLRGNTVMSATSTLACLEIVL